MALFLRTLAVSVAGLGGCLSAFDYCPTYYVHSVSTGDVPGWTWITRYVGVSGYVPTFVVVETILRIRRSARILISQLERLGAKRLFAADAARSLCFCFAN